MKISKQVKDLPRNIIMITLPSVTFFHFRVTNTLYCVSFKFINKYHWDS